MAEMSTTTPVVDRMALPRSMSIGPTPAHGGEPPAVQLPEASGPTHHMLVVCPLVMVL
jgi:hypothetical protein